MIAKRLDVSLERIGVIGGQHKRVWSLRRILIVEFFLVVVDLIGRSVATSGSSARLFNDRMSIGATISKSINTSWWWIPMF